MIKWYWCVEFCRRTLMQTSV